LNHHIRNAITQITMASYLADPDKQQRIRCEAVERILGRCTESRTVQTSTRYLWRLISPAWN
jgi:hypothetical protein